MILRSITNLVLIYALILGVMVLPNVTSMSHMATSTNVEEITRHNALDPVDVSYHGHAHDDGEDHERMAGHNHGHDPADHSHQVALVSHIAMGDIQIRSDTPQSKSTGVLRSRMTSGIDRPPKLFAQI